MFNGKTISLKTILWKVLRNPLASDLTYEEAAEHAIEAIKLIGSPLMFEDKLTDPLLKIIDNKALLPDNLLNIKGVRLINNTDDYDNNSIALRYATDVYHNITSCDNNSNDNESIIEYTYTVQRGIIFTSFQEGYIQMSYKALATDDEGYPLIPDNEKVIMALEYYILFRYLEPLWMIGKITDKAFQYIDQKKCFYIGGANTSMKLQGPDQAESIMNTINRMIINKNAFNSFYKGTGRMERTKRYN